MNSLALGKQLEWFSFHLSYKFLVYLFERLWVISWSEVSRQFGKPHKKT